MPGGPTLGALTAELRPVTLEVVLATANLQARVDRKYVVPLDSLADVLGTIGDQLHVLEIDGLRGFSYESVYFDTPSLTAYHQHAHGRRRRAKIRTRTYLDSGECLLEFKRVGSRGETIKERFPYRLDSRFELDVDLRFDGPSGGSYGPTQGVAVVESKSAGGDSPADRALRRVGVRPVTLSKYCVGMALLDRRLPANRWNRELRTYFAWSPEPRAAVAAANVRR